MKLILKIISVVLLVVIALMVILPIVYEEKISELAKEEINKQIDGKVDFSDMSLSLFRNFPNFTLEVEELLVTGNEDFATDTLAAVRQIKVVVDLFSVLAGDRYEVEKIIVNQPTVSFWILEDGRANFDIAKKSEEPVDQEPSEGEADFQLLLKRFQVINGKFSYIDEQSGMKVKAVDFNNLLSGGFSGDFSSLSNSTQIESLTIGIGGINYLNQAQLNYEALIDADLKNSIYTFGKNKLSINELGLTFSGSISTLEEGINLVLTFNSPDNQFKDLLSMVPALYSKEFERIRADGRLSIDGNIKGIYSEDALPAFRVNVLVEEGMFAYPQLTGKVTDIAVIASVQNPGGEADQTTVDVSQCALKLGENAVFATLKLKHPVSDPEIDARLKGTVDLSTLHNYYPLEEELSGSFLTDITLQGKLSAIEEERYSEFVALGSVLIQNLNYPVASLNQPVEVSNAQLNFSPQYLDLVDFNMQMGKSGLRASGKLSNYLAYFLKNGELKGNLKLRSDYFNLDELISKEETVTDEAKTDEPMEEESDDESSEILELPDRIDFTLDASLQQFIYDQIEMKRVRGQVRLSDQKLTLKNLRMDAVKGEMIVNGFYSTQKAEEPEVALDFRLNKLDIPSAYNHFAVMRTYLPIAKKTTGNFSANLKLETVLDKKMMPVYESMNGNGKLTTSAIEVNDLNSFVQLASALNYTDLEKLELDGIEVDFEFVNGKMAVKPFQIEYNDIKADIEGWTGFDQKIGYVMDLSIPREKLGADANQLMDNLVAEANKLGGNFTLPENIAFDVVIEGTLTNPKVRTSLAESGNDLVEKAKEEIVKQVSKEAMARAQQILDEAEKQSKSIIAEAEKQANRLKKDAEGVVEDLRVEYDKQADSLIALGKKNGFVAEMAAKEAARQLKAEADKKAQELLQESDKQADKLVEEARKTAKRIRDEAQRQADALLKKE